MTTGSYTWRSNKLLPGLLRGHQLQGLRSMGWRRGAVVTWHHGAWDESLSRELGGGLRCGWDGWMVGMVRTGARHRS